MTLYKGACFCGAVHVEAEGEPIAMGYCHCRSCRSWSAAPVNAFTLWKPEAVRLTRGCQSRQQSAWCEVTSTDYVSSRLEFGRARAKAEGHTIQGCCRAHTSKS